jgi:broad specificity phosphatase PhoE
VPPVAGKSPVAHVGNAPFRRRFEVDHEVDACAVGTVDEAPAEDHLALSFGRAELASCETKRGQDRIEDGGNAVECGVVRWERVRHERHDRHYRIVGVSNGGGTDQSRARNLRISAQLRATIGTRGHIGASGKRFGFRTLAVMSLRVVIVQHGDRERLPGDPGLTELGLAQALATARWLGRGETPPVGIWSSPMRRARETASPIADELGVLPITDARLRERMNWGDSLAESIEDFLEDWRTASADRAYVPRSGDSSFGAASRFLEALDDLAAAHPSGTAIVVAHGGVTTDVLRTLLGDDELRTNAPALIDDGVPSCAITTLQGSNKGWAVASIAVVDHLDDHPAQPP